MRKVLGTLVLLGGTASCLWAQVPAGAVAPGAAEIGSLSGTVLDAAGEAVAGALVRLTHADTGAQATSRTENTGEFSFPALAAGTYSATVSGFGFNPAKAEGIQIAPQANTSLGTVTLELDVDPVHLVVDPSRPGRPFAGIGGNFRLQHPRTDRQVVAYNLEHLNVTWGRICMRWSEWHPEEEMDPLSEARAGNLRAPVRQTMEMARELARRNIPIIASIWFPPPMGGFRGWSEGRETEKRPAQPEENGQDLQIDRRLSCLPQGSLRGRAGLVLV